ncbi:MAG: glycosyltransferase family 9 protein [Actinomycetota bacterium]|nr:glycosyltransferase family 9 protein [Actinomycetota bacterium]
MTATRSTTTTLRQLVARLDNVGDVLLAGPAVRAVARRGPVTFLASSAGAAAASMLPGVAEVLTFDAPWVAFDPPPVSRCELDRLRDAIEERRIDEAMVLTSHHQSPLPLALLLREAGVGRIAATCIDYPGALLDVRGRYLPELHEVEQSLHLCREAGVEPEPDDRGALEVLLGPRRTTLPDEPYVVVHPGASVSSRGLPLEPIADVIGRLAALGVRVVVTGSGDETELVARLLDGIDLDASAAAVTCSVGALDLEQFAHLLSGAAVLVSGNTGPVHLAAAVGTPVVEAFAPVVPAHRWRPWKVPHVLLGHLDATCPSACSRGCTVESQPCLEPFSPDAVIAAVTRLALGSIPQPVPLPVPATRTPEEVDA